MPQYKYRFSSPKTENLKTKLNIWLRQPAETPVEAVTFWPKLG